MKPETAEWVEKAEGDFHTAEREKNTVEYPNYDATCFHAQQCAEKYLKARLIEAGKDFPKTHDLSAILNLVLPFEPTWEFLREELEQLTNLGVEVRYPGMTADLEDAEEAMRTAQHVRQIVRTALKAEE
ncbi:MAG: HEPN domain-containing protein [Planctomycetota bacterium]|jgi:HEPN domain-containing protein